MVGSTLAISATSRADHDPEEQLEHDDRDRQPRRQQHRIRTAASAATPTITSSEASSIGAVTASVGTVGTLSPATDGEGSASRVLLVYRAAGASSPWRTRARPSP